MTGPDPAAPPIVLTTDFGLSDAFVGVMKGVILGINPAATIIDLSHDIGPQDLRQGSFLLGCNHSFFPPGTIHVAVVDPGVGTSRKGIVLQTPSATFVAPDNGLLSEIVKPLLGTGYSGMPAASIVALPPGVKAWELSNPKYRLHPVSSTFHGRDVFAPAAAHLSLAVDPSDMGPALSEMVYLPLPEPVVTADRIQGEVIYVDRFGNLVTNVSGAEISQSVAEPDSLGVEIGGRRIGGLSRTFHDSSTGRGSQPDGIPLVALVGSNGFLEIAVRDGSASRALGLGTGETVRVSFGSRPA